MGGSPIDAKFTFSEFRVCVRAIFAFGAGYKLGERYELGELIRYLDEVLGHICTRQGVWKATGSEIIDWFKAHSG
jgi:hypothetical protein